MCCVSVFCFLIVLRPPTATRTNTLLPYTPLSPSPAGLATGRASWWADVPASAHAGGVTRRGAVLMTGLTEEVPRVARIQIADVEQHEHVGAIEVAIPIRFAAGFRAKAEKIGRDHV